ncbi:BTB/POZ protein [Pilaira anomala]|nr:BTB/POZ protein [Pilaira anomala]
MVESFIVKLDVGGTIYRTTLDTLVESEYLFNLVNGGWMEGSSEQNNIFIDRDGFLFRYILLYLRTGEVSIEKNHRESLKNEAEFYLLPELTRKINVMIEAEKPKETTYALLSQEEFVRFANIDVTGILGRSSDRMVVGLNKHFIVSIRCAITSYDCPRGVFSHKKSQDCGVPCARARGQKKNSYTAKETYMYLVSTTV